MKGKQADGKRIFRGLFFLALLLSIFSLRPAGAEENPGPYDRVIIIGVDGAGTKFREGKTPNFDRIFGGGVITDDARATVPTNSAPGWGAMFYGVPGEMHGTDNSIAINTQKTNELYPSIFKLTKDAFPEAAVVSFVNWYPINLGLIEQGCGIDFVPAKKIDLKKEEMVEQALAYLEKKEPKLMFICFNDQDDALHSYGFGSKEYLEESARIDVLIGTVYDALEQKGLLENALILFVTDHGGHEKSHGGGTEEETRVTFAAAGPGVETGGIIEDMELQDVAAIVLYALGIGQPENQTGRVPKGIFPGIGGAERRRSELPERMKRYGKGTTTGMIMPEPALPAELAEKAVYCEHFDGEVKGLAGAKEAGSGLIGRGLNTRTSFVKTDVKTTAKWPGFTVAFWFRDEGGDGDPPFVTDKNWRHGHNKGFMIAMGDEALQVNIGSGQAYRKDLFWKLPEDYQKKWIHCLVTFDFKTRMVSLYCDFVQVGKAMLLTKKYSNWATGKKMTVGQDNTGKYFHQLNGEMDEVLIFKEALSPEEIKQLRMCYEPYFTE